MMGREGRNGMKMSRRGLLIPGSSLLVLPVSIFVSSLVLHRGWMLEEKRSTRRRFVVVWKIEFGCKFDLATDASSSVAILAVDQEQRRGAGSRIEQEST